MGIYLSHLYRVITATMPTTLKKNVSQFIANFPAFADFAFANITAATRGDNNQEDRISEEQAI